MKIDYSISDEKWDAFVERHANAHPLQLTAWGTLKSSFGWSSERIVVLDGSEIAAGAQVLFRTLFPGMTLGYVPRGPLLDLERPDHCDALFERLHHACRARHAFAVKIEPHRIAPTPIASYLSEKGFHPSQETIQPRRTIWVDLCASPDDILGRMKSKTRYNIRLSARRDIQVHTPPEAKIDDFNDLMAITGERDEFGIRSPEYYRHMYELFAPADSARLFIATYHDQPLAGLLALACGANACYLAGASSNEHRERMPTYAVQWAAIEWAKERGCQIYDLYGIPDYGEDDLEAQFTERSDGLWGVYRFKRGFGGQVVRLAGAFDYVYNRPIYKLYQFAKKLKG
jgi:lipid II:glycine glycyltransferase (peptidoglycan interpeptide bridge formation enzyme)